MHNNSFAVCEFKLNNPHAFGPLIAFSIWNIHASDLQCENLDNRPLVISIFTSLDFPSFLLANLSPLLADVLQHLAQHQLTRHPVRNSKYGRSQQYHGHSLPEAPILLRDPLIQKLLIRTSQRKHAVNMQRALEQSNTNN
jgi:hypothetical protein